MLKNYLKTAWRFIGRNFIFSGINCIGLSIALAASFLIILFIVNEWSYDRFHDKKERIYRIINYDKSLDTYWSGTPYVLASYLKEEFPEVENVINIARTRNVSILLENEKIAVRNAVGSSSAIFDVFTIPLLSGNKDNQLLKDEHSICLSEQLALKIFNETNVVGKEVKIAINKKELLFTVTGVYQDLPKNSTLKADCFLPDSYNLKSINAKFDYLNDWKKTFWRTYILVKKGVNANEVNSKFGPFLEKHFQRDEQINYILQKLTDVYLFSDHINNSWIKGSIKNIKLFAVIGFLILLVASFNYVILSTAVSAQRSKEIGIRKTFGAESKEVRSQFLVESILLSLLVLPLALSIMYLLLPFASHLFGVQLQIISSNLPYYISFYILLSIIIGVISGLYTSMGLSRLQIMNILKPQITSGKRKNTLRASLIIIQLVIFCFFVSCAFLVRTQYEYSLHKDPGFHNTNILTIRVPKTKYYQPLLDKIRQNPNVISAAGTFESLPTRNGMITHAPHFTEKDKKVRIHNYVCDYGFLETSGIKLKEGRYFSDKHRNDFSEACIINETAVQKLGISDPLHKEILQRKIIGVCKDFNFQSFHSDIQPLMIRLEKEYLRYISIHYRVENLDDLLAQLTQIWHDTAEEQQMKTERIEDLLASLYTKEKNLSHIISLFAVLTLIISAMGLFGLSLFISRSRTKEIGIKKVLGCSQYSIVFSFLKNNLIYIGIAAVISIPISLYAMKKWLNEYAVQVGINWWIFVLAFLFAAIVVLSTILIHSIKASKQNAIKALRYE